MQDKTLTPTVSSVTDFTSGPVDLGDMTHYSLHAVFSGSDVAGTFKLQVSNTTTSTDFVDLSGAASSITWLSILIRVVFALFRRIILQPQTAHLLF